MNDINRIKLLRRTGLMGAAVATTGAAVVTASPDSAAEDTSSRMFTHPVIGTWRGTVDQAGEELEQTLIGFYPGGLLTTFSDGIHIALGSWEDRGDDRVRFAIWQVLPVDMNGQPHEYIGEVRARHDARLSGDELVTTGVGLFLDLDGNVRDVLDVTVEARRYRLELPDWE